MAFPVPLAIVAGDFLNPSAQTGVERLDLKIKIVVFAICLLSTAAALGQNMAGVSALSNQSQMLQLPDHPQHASLHALAPEQTLLPSSSIVYARGEQPLWEFAPKEDIQPLGDIARIFRKEHAEAKKAVMVWDK